MSTGLHARQATGLTGLESEETFTRTKSVARWSREGRAAYKAERSSAVRLLFQPTQRTPIRREIITSEGTGIASPFQIFVSPPLFSRCCAVLCFLFRTSLQKDVRTCMRHPSCFSGWSVELLAFASRLFALKKKYHLFCSFLPHERA